MCEQGHKAPKRGLETKAEANFDSVVVCSEQFDIAALALMVEIDEQAGVLRCPIQRSAVLK